MATGPQKYPGASTAYWYQGTYGGDQMEVNVVALHTTEGRSLPDYGGGASAPNLTAVPDFAAKKLKWYQHFDIDRSSRALVNLAGGVATNTLNVVQVELVGTCDPATHNKWTAAGSAHIYWPEAPDWALAEVARFLAWAHAEHGVPLTGPSKWPAYPTSYANGGGQRMTGAQWEAFSGICGHMHVTENVHGDPGAINFTELIALAKGGAIPVPEEDDVSLTTAQAKQLTELHEALVEKTLTTRASDSGIAYSLGQHVAATNGWVAQLVTMVTTLTAREGAQDAALNTVLAAVTSGGGLTAEQVKAAADAGAEAALDRLGDALTP